MLEFNESINQQQSESANSNNKKKTWCSYHKSQSHPDDQCYHQRNGSRSSSADSKHTKDETFVADSNVTGCNSNFCCKCKCKNKYNEINDESCSPPPRIGFTFAACHLPLSQQVDGFQPLVDSSSSKHLIDPKLIRGVESRMLVYTRIKPPKEIGATGDNVLRGTVQGILLVVVRGTDDVLRTVKLPIVLVPGLTMNSFSTSAAAQKGVTTIIEKSGSSLDLEAFSFQLTRLDNMEYLDLTIAKEVRRMLRRSRCIQIFL